MALDLGKYKIVSQPETEKGAKESIHYVKFGNMGYMHRFEREFVQYFPRNSRTKAIAGLIEDSVKSVIPELEKMGYKNLPKQ